MSPYRYEMTKNELDVLPYPPESQQQDTNHTSSNNNDDDSTNEECHNYQRQQQRRQRRSLWTKLHYIFTVSSAAFVCICLISHELRPYHVKQRRRSLPLSSRRILLFHSSSSSNVEQSNEQWHRQIQEDEDEQNKENESNDNQSKDEEEEEEEENDRENENEENNDDDDKQNAYYENEEEENDDDAKETVYIEDDFFRFVDDDDVWQRNLLPLETSDILGLLCTSMSLILAAAGGIGAGAILVAIFMIIMDFPAKVAIPLSCVTGLSVATAGTIMNARKRHPFANRPIIDWDLILIMEPLTLLGALAGTLINKVLPDKFLVTLLVLLLTAIANSTLKKAQKMYYAEEIYIKRAEWARKRREQRHKQRYRAITGTENKVTIDENQNKNLGSPQRTDEKSKAENEPLTFIKVHNVDTVKSSIMVEEADPLPQNKITYIVTMFIFVIAIVVFKGGGSFESPLGIKCGSASFWMVNLVTTIWLIGCTYLAGIYLLRMHEIKEAVGFDYVRGDIKWDLKTIFVYPSTCIVAGLASGTLGIGSAIVTAPLMMGFGVHATVSAATSSCMNFFTSLAATSSYVVLGSIIPDYAIICSIIGFSATYFGRLLMNKSLRRKSNRKFERHSYIAYSMGTVVLVSALLMTAEVILSIFTNRRFLQKEVETGICESEY